MQVKNGEKNNRTSQLSFSDFNQISEWCDYDQTGKHLNTLLFWCFLFCKTIRTDMKLHLLPIQKVLYLQQIQRGRWRTCNNHIERPGSKSNLGPSHLGATVFVAASLCCFGFIYTSFFHNLHSGWTALCHSELREKQIDSKQVGSLLQGRQMQHNRDWETCCQHVYFV